MCQVEECSLSLASDLRLNRVSIVRQSARDWLTAQSKDGQRTREFNRFERDSFGTSQNPGGSQRCKAHRTILVHARKTMSQYGRSENERESKKGLLLLRWRGWQ